MESLAAFSIAMNVAQFLDFGQRLSTTMIDIWKSAKGLTKSNYNTEMLARTFLNSLDSVSEDLAEYHKFLHGDEANAFKTIQAQYQIQGIVNGCRDLATDLIRRVNKLRCNNGRPQKWETFMLAFKTLWEERELRRLEKEFSKFRGELDSVVVFSLRSTMNAESAQRRLLDSRREDQFERLQASIDVLATIIHSRLLPLPQWTRTCPKDQDSSCGCNGEAGIKRFKTPSLSPSVQSVHSKACEMPIDPDDCQPTLELAFANAYATKLRDEDTTILASLAFPVMHDREEAISTAEISTFEWIFKSPKSYDRPWDHFGEWLSGKQSLYWINGKAGSGKSTLMKYLSVHTDIKSLLREWTQASTLLIASFFFWYSGHELQKMQLGLLRSLLHSCLKDHRELIPLIIPETIESSRLPTYWTIASLKRAFMKLVTQTIFDLKFCFFIDGLDEYAGSHLEIASFIKDLTEFPNVKVCTSSRPLTIFDRMFKGSPHLVLQNLTFDDINLYVENRLSSNEMMQDLEKDEPGLQAELTSNIVSKASGVFLWVRLVVQSLLEGLGNEDDAFDLHRRINDLPPDLEDLYWHMINRVEPPWYLEEGFRLLRLVKACEGRVSLLHLYLADHSIAFGQSVLLSDPSLEEQTKMCQKMARRLKSRCLGLLEVTWDNDSDCRNHIVAFIHKSVYDFLETERVESRMLNIPRQKCFHVEPALMKGALTELKLVKTWLKRRGFDDYEIPRAEYFDNIRPIICRFFKWARLSEENLQLPEVELVDELERTVIEIWNCVILRSRKEKDGLIHWMAASKSLGSSAYSTNPGMGCKEGNESFQDIDLTLTWEVVCQTPQKRTLGIPSFDALAQVAGLKLYTQAKHRTPIPFASFGDADALCGQSAIS